MKNKIINIIKLIRPKDHIKNLFVLAPAFFAGKISSISIFKNSCQAFLSFCLIASAVYILNDIKDLPEDRQHPIKKNRPLARGAISIKEANVLLIIFISLGIILSFSLPIIFSFILIIYFTINLAYSFGLKHIAIIDIFCVASGFVLRILAGGVAVNVPISMWIIIMTFLLALFLSIGKRRDDYNFLNKGLKTRRCINGYNLEFINASMILMAGVITVSYILYTVSPEITEKFDTKNLYFTVFFVLLGLMRYFQLIMVQKRSADPIKIFWEDRFLQLTVSAWLAVFGYFIYFPGGR